MLTALQSLIWTPLKRRVPGFIQGLDKQEFTKLFRSRVNENMRSISLDGSAFDSTQSKAVMECVDDIFWTHAVEKFRPVFEQLSQLNYVL